MAFNRMQGAGSGRHGDGPEPAGAPAAGASVAGASMAGTPLAGSPYSLRDLLTVVFRERRLMMMVALGIIALGVMVSQLIPVTYTATNKLLVLSGQEYQLRPDASSALPPMAMDQNQVVHTEIEIFNSAMLIERVIEDIGVDQLYPEIARFGEPSNWLARLVTGAHRLISRNDGAATTDALGEDRDTTAGEPDNAQAKDPETAIAAGAQVLEALRLRRLATELAIFVFRQNIKVLPVKDANVIEFSFTHRDPVLAAKVLNQLLEDGLNYRRQLLSRTKPQQFVEQRDAFKVRLNDVEGQIERFKLRYNISSFVEEKALLLRRYAEMVATRQTSEARLAEVVAQLGILREALDKVPEQINLYSDSSTQDSNDTARSTLVSLEMRRNELLARFKENSRFVQDLDLQINDLKRILAATPPKLADSKRMGRNPLYDDMKTKIVGAESEEGALRHRLETVKLQEQDVAARMARFDEIEHQYNDLIRERDLVDQNFKTYAQNAEMAVIQAEQEHQKSANIRIIEEARPPTRSNNPRMLIIALSVLAGLLGSLGVVFMIDFFRDTLLTPDAAERNLRLPVLVAIPYKGANSPQSRRGRPQQRPAAG